MRFRPILPLSSSISLAAAAHRLPSMSSAACAPIPALALPRTSRNGARISLGRGFARSRVSMAASVVSQASLAVEDSLFKDYQPTHAFLFPGQGAQTVGMGAQAQSVQGAAELFKKANDILGFDLLDVCTNGPKEKLDSTIISQPAIYVASLAAVEVLRAREDGQDIINSVDVTCGLSLGEYTSLAFAGAFRMLQMLLVVT